LRKAILQVRGQNIKEDEESSQTRAGTVTPCGPREWKENEKTIPLHSFAFSLARKNSDRIIQIWKRPTPTNDLPRTLLFKK